MEKLLTIKEASEVLRLKVSTLYSMVERKTIPHVKLGSRVMFSPESLSQWIAERTVNHG